MRIIGVTALVLLNAAGCAVTETFYLPADPALAREGTVCGSVPYGHGSVILADDVRMSFSIAPDNQRIGASFTVSVPNGAQVRFPEPVVMFTTPTGTQSQMELSQWETSIYGRGGAPGYTEQLLSNAPLAGRGRNAAVATESTQYLRSDQFRSHGQVAVPVTSELTMTLPRSEINGRVLGARSVPLKLVERTGVMACVQ